MSGAFFAELSAKICHHNINVAREGCAMLQRLLTTDISALLLLNEGKVLAMLQDVLSGIMLGGGQHNKLGGGGGGGSEASANAFGQGMRAGADGKIMPGVSPSSSPLAPSVWQECELVLQILDVLLLFSERLLSFVGPQTTSQAKAIASAIQAVHQREAEMSITQIKPIGGGGGAATSSLPPPPSLSSSTDNYIRHLDNADMFFLSFCSLLSSILALPPRRGLIALTQGRFRAAFWLVLGWCNDISPHFIRCVLAAFGSDSVKGKNEAALRMLMLTNGMVNEDGTPTQPQHHHGFSLSHRMGQPILTPSGAIHQIGGGATTTTTILTDAATSILNRLGPQKSLLIHKIEGFFLNKNNGPASGFSTESVIDGLFYVACRKIWRQRDARVKALIAPHYASSASAAAAHNNNNSYPIMMTMASGGSGGASLGYFGNDNGTTTTAAETMPKTADDTLDEPEGISIISGNVSIIVGDHHQNNNMNYYYPSSTHQTSALNKTPAPITTTPPSVDASEVAVSSAPSPPVASPTGTTSAASTMVPLLTALQKEVEALRSQMECAQSHETYCDGLSRLWSAVTSAIAAQGSGVMCGLNRGGGGEGLAVTIETIFDFIPFVPSAASSSTQQQQGAAGGGILRNSNNNTIPIGGPIGFLRFFNACLKRMFTVLPANTNDAVLFHWSMRTVGHLLLHSPSSSLSPAVPSSSSSQPQKQSMRTVILSNCCTFLVTALSASAASYASTVTLASSSSSTSSPYQPTSALSSAAPDSTALFNAFSANSRRNVPSKLSLISTEMEILAFLRIAEECSTSSQLEPWIRSGLFSSLVAYVEPFGASSSLLTDAPTLHDGSLSEDVYLASALQTCRNEACCIAATSMKLLCSIVTNHAAMLCEVFPAEAFSCVAIAVPMLARVAINNPTVEVSPAQQQFLTETDSTECKSLVYRLPSFSQRSSRYTPVGECAVLALDALLCMPLCHSANGQIGESLIPFLPALARATVRSVFPHLRGTLFRCLTRTINSASELLNLVKVMPSSVASAVAVVISYDGARMREWEVSAAAEWLAQVLRLTLADNSVSASFNFLQTALPLKLLQMSTLNGASYVSGTLLSLLMGIVRQQQLMLGGGGGGSGGVTILGGQPSALAPQSARSLPHWRTLMSTAIASLKSIREKWAKASSFDVDEEEKEAEKKTPSVTIAPDVVDNSPKRKGDSDQNENGGLMTAVSSYVSSDAPHRYVAMMESVTSQLLFANGILRGLSALFYHHQDLREHFSQEEMLHFLEHILNCPTPETIATTMAGFYRTELLFSKPLQKAFEQMQMSLCELFARGWYAGPPRDVQHYPLDIVKALVPIAQMMADRSLTIQCRQCFAALVSCMIQHAVPQHTELTESMANVGDALFLATTCLPPSPVTIAAQCRLVSSFQLANEAAFQCGWVDLAIRSAYQIVVGRVVIPVNGRVPDSSSAQQQPPLQKLDAVREQQLTELLSIVSSAFSFPFCRVTHNPRDAEGAELLSRLLLRLLSAAVPSLRLLALHTCRALASSEEGRGVLALEAASGRQCPADSSDRSCFMKLAYATLGAVMNSPQFGSGGDSSAPAGRATTPNRRPSSANGGGGMRPSSVQRSISASRRSGGVASSSVSAVSSSSIMYNTPSGSSTSRLPHHLSPEFHIGVDIVSVTIAKGGEHFASAVVKQRCVENVETYMLHMARARQQIPIAFYRFLAAVSFSSEVQPILCKRAELLTLLYEMASMTVSGQLIVDGTLGAGNGSASSPSSSSSSSSAALLASQHVEKSSLALLALRNISFYPTTKLQLCQDTRLMTLFKDCLIAASSSSSRNQQQQQNGFYATGNFSSSSPAATMAAPSTAVMGRNVVAAGGNLPHHHAPSTPLSPSSASMPILEIFRRQQLAVSAFAALVYQNQRAKSYVRGVLLQPPTVDVSALLDYPNLIANANTNSGGDEDLAPPPPMEPQYFTTDPTATAANAFSPYRNPPPMGSGGGGASPEAAVPMTMANADPYYQQQSQASPLRPPRDAFEFYQRSAAESAALLQALSV